jgi:meso-butanediol dehydrogenase / (S,S)-butanediol dehydrogenase / diacetyl reductase
MTAVLHPRFADRVVAITGTADGQGRAAALLFAAEGAIVAGCDIDAEGNAETVSMVTAAGGRMLGSAPVDLTTESATSDWIDSVVSEAGRIDVLYANAGATRFNPITEVSLDEWSFVMRHELDIVFVPVKFAWPALIASGGAVILVGSTAGLSGSLTNARIAHTASKGGVIAMTKQLAAEGAAHGIRVNLVVNGGWSAVLPGAMPA